MPVCLHCGEIGPDGALFCGKCGFTLPQAADGASPTAPLRPAGAAPAPPAGPVGPVLPPSAPLRPAVAPPATYAAPAPPIPGAVGPMAPPPNAKYCVRCATLISRAAVYCPVCQQPQP